MFIRPRIAPLWPAWPLRTQALTENGVSASKSPMSGKVTAGPGWIRSPDRPSLPDVHA
jgi:hypothetical protein